VIKQAKEKNRRPEYHALKEHHSTLSAVKVMPPVRTTVPERGTRLFKNITHNERRKPSNYKSPREPGDEIGGRQREKPQGRYRKSTPGDGGSANRPEQQRVSERGSEEDQEVKENIKR